MMFRVPSLATYFTGLIVVALLAALAYPVLGDAKAVTLLAVGLFVGHLIGSFLGPQASTGGATGARREAPPAAAPTGSGETTSLYVGNIAFNAPKAALRDLFADYGEVISVRLMTDRATRKPRGYGFVEMDVDAARAAIAALDGAEFFGRSLRVSEAKQQEAPQRSR
jgi:hypothetical protein